MNLTLISHIGPVFDFCKNLYFQQNLSKNAPEAGFGVAGNLTSGTNADDEGLSEPEIVLSRTGKTHGTTTPGTWSMEPSKMSFFKVMLMTIAIVFSGTWTIANAQPTKPEVHVTKSQKQKGQKPTVKKAVIRKSNDQAYCLGQVMANEGNPNMAGWVSTAYTVLARGQSGDYGKVGDYCAAAHAKNQYTAFNKAPTAEMLKVAQQMLTDVKNGAPTIEVALQRKLNGAEFFHNASVNETVGVRWREKYRLITIVEGHWMYRDKNGKSPYRNLDGASPAVIVASN